MVTLLEYIDLCIQRAKKRNAAKSDFFSNFSRCRSSVALYLGDDQSAPLMRVIDPDFILGYARFLYSGAYAQAVYDSNKPGRRSSFSTKSLDDHLTRLRTVVRSAIRDGLIPNIDIFPQVLDLLASSGTAAFPPISAGIPSVDRRSYRAASFDFEAEIERLSNTALGNISTRPKVKNALPMLMYLLGIYSYGMEIEDLLSLTLPPCLPPPPDKHPIDESVIAYHPRLGKNVFLPERALRLINLLNNGAPRDAYVITRWKGWGDLTPRDIAARICRQLDDSFAQCGISLFRNRSIYADWLGMMASTTIGDDAVIALSKSDTAYIDAHWDAISACADQIADDHGVFLKRWYILRSYKHRYDSTLLRDQVAEYLADCPDFKKNRDSYDPRALEKRELRGRIIKRNSPVISRFLFVHSTLDVARRIDKMNDFSSLMRVIGNRTTFATVAHRDVVDLINFLRDYRDDVQLVDIKLPEPGKQFAEGVKVRILSGPLKGAVGTISQVIKAKKLLASPSANPFLTPEDSTLYRVSVDGFAMARDTIALLTGLDLDPAD